MSKSSKKLHEMSDAEFEAYLKTNKITGMGAANAGRTRRAVVKAMGVDPNKPQPISGKAPSKNDPVLGTAKKLSGEQGAEVFRDPLPLGKATVDETVLSSIRKQTDKPLKPGSTVVIAAPPLDPENLPEGYKFTEITPPGRKDEGNDMDRALAYFGARTIDLTPTFSSVMGYYEVVILDATRKGRQELIPDIRKMAALSDLCNSANGIIARLLKKQEEGTSINDDIEAMKTHMKAVEEVKAKFQ